MSCSRTFLVPAPPPLADGRIKLTHDIARSRVVVSVYLAGAWHPLRHVTSAQPREVPGEIPAVDLRVEFPIVEVLPGDLPPAPPRRASVLGRDPDHVPPYISRRIHLTVDGAGFGNVVRYDADAGWAEVEAKPGRTAAGRHGDRIVVRLIGEIGLSWRPDETGTTSGG